jgi:hypothetical protein
MDAVRDAAQTLTREGKVLTVGNPEFPLAVFADTYKVDDEPTNTALPDEEMVAVEDHFDAINQDTTPAEDDSRESIVANLGQAVAKVQFNTTNVIIPAIKAMHQTYAGMQSASCQPEYSVKAWRYLAPHNSATLVNHINTRYTTVRPKDSYKSFQLEGQTAESIIEMMSVNNPHLEQEEITEWALQVGSARLELVWNSLFTTGHVMPAGLPYLSAQAAPFNVDDLLVAYFICGHYIDNPVVVPNFSVDLEEWEHTMKLLHEMFGFYLMRAYVRRADMREQGVMILKNEATNPIATRRAIVTVNGDVFDPWVVGGGDIQAILGAAVENTGVTDVKYLNAAAHKFIERWHEIYPMIQQAAIDYSDRQRLNNVISAFREIGRSELLKDRYTPEMEQGLIEALRYVRRDDYDNPYKVFSALVCRVYFPESTYLEYLDAIDQFGQTYTKATVRELATQAMITLVAIFQAKQVKVEMFSAEIDPEGSATGPIDDSGLLAIADDEATDEGEAGLGGDELGIAGEEGTVGDAGVNGDDGLSDVGLGDDTSDLGDGLDDTAGDLGTDGTADDTDLGDATGETDVAETGEAETDVEEDFTGDGSDEEADPYADLETDEGDEEEVAEEVEETEEAETEVEQTETEATEETESTAEATDAEESEEAEVEETETTDEESEEDDETPLT